jgi:hypothetical protein
VLLKLYQDKAKEKAAMEKTLKNVYYHPHIEAGVKMLSEAMAQMEKDILCVRQAKLEAEQAVQQAFQQVIA